MTQDTLRNWIGFSTYLVIDSFAAGLFANVIANNSFIPVFKREYKSGLYTPSMYYFGTWLIKVMCLSFYPLLLYTFVFHCLELRDDSTENFVFFIKVAVISGLNSATLGHMWGALFEETNTLCITAFCAMSFFALGAGHMVRNGSNPITNTIIWLSPMSKTTELVLRVVTS
jgi:hypothetical protein